MGRPPPPEAEGPEPDKPDDDTREAATATATRPEDSPENALTDGTDADPETKPPAVTEPPPTEGDEPSKAQPGDGEDADLVEVNVLGNIESVSRKELVRGYQTT
jgi:hypothetical protein